MVTRRRAVGAHYGLGDWMLQRLTAVVMALYTLLLLGVVLVAGGIDYTLWRSLFAGSGFKYATFLFMVSLLYHAWVGARDIFMDYVKPTGIRVTLYAATIALLIAYLGWTIQILWGLR
jgi:succinate dehydrogenase / fumarate reductase membrane anchor subunit